VGGPADIALVLDHRLGAVWSPENLEERLELASELVGQAELAGDRVTELRGRAFLVSALLESGHAARADRELQVASRLAEELRQPVFLWHTLGLRVVRAAMEGRFDEADVLAEEARAAGRMADAAAADHYYVVQTAILERRSREELADFEGPVRSFTERFPALPWRGVLALLYAELGRRSEARREFERMAAEDWTDVQRDSNWLMAMVTSAKVCALLGDVERARVLYELLLPFSGRYVVLGRVAAYSVGAAARYIALLATTLEDWEGAEEQFEKALKLDQAMGARMWEAETRYDYGRMLLARGLPGDAERAAELIGEALREAETLGLKRMLEREAEAATEAEAVPVREPVGAGTAPGSAKRVAVFRRRGDFWEIGYEGDAHLVKDLKGLGYVATLLGNPGTEIHVGDLASELEAAPDLGDAGAMLDPDAKEAYRGRLEDLREELAQAEEWGDPERASRAREEIEFLGKELAGAVGLGGRDRKAASVSERARVNVTRAIRSAVQRVAENDPELARHLDTAIRTGTFCSYEPDPHAGLRWTL
jgi:tetratricopeptide (TPR) repeat protein